VNYKKCGRRFPVMCIKGPDIPDKEAKENVKKSS